MITEVWFFAMSYNAKYWLPSLVVTRDKEIFTYTK